MAQYLAISGSSFGNAHSDNPTYAFSVGTGDIFLSGSGGYVNTPTGITKATLTAGIKLKVTDETIAAVTCSVESGFTCTDTIAYATWTAPSPTPTVTPTITPTATPAPSGTTFSITAEYTLNVPASPGSALFVFNGGSSEVASAAELVKGLSGQSSVSQDTFYNISGRPNNAKIYRHTYPYDQADGATVSFGSSAQIKYVYDGVSTQTTVTITDTGATSTISEAEDIWIWNVY